MSDGKEPGLFQRLFGIGDKPAEPAKKDPPQDSPKRDWPPEEPLKELPTDRTAKKDPPTRKGSAKSAKPQAARLKAAKPKAPPPAGPRPVPNDAPPEERHPAHREKKTADKAAPSVFEPNTPRPKRPEPEPPQPSPPPAGSHVKPKAAIEPKRSWFDQLRQGLARTSTALSDNLAGALTKRKLDEDTLDRIEEVLIKADLGVAMAGRIRSAIAKGRYDRGLDADAVREVVASEVTSVLEPVASDFDLDSGARPYVFLVVGVNGTGKTTTAAKMAHQFKRRGFRVMLAAADTFRAAAIDQLKVWGGRVGAEVVAKEVGADPAGVSFAALERAREAGADVLLIDTAGRLQNKSDLMAELAKIVRVLKKLDATAPHGVILVLDATTGQNAIAQVDIFKEIAGVTGLVVTKLDGTARGGILVAIAERFKLPIAAVGVGEGLDDLKPFDARDFARAIAGAKSENEAAA
jgi:fused signal recognition particle receptor